MTVNIISRDNNLYVTGSGVFRITPTVHSPYFISGYITSSIYSTPQTGSHTYHEATDKIFVIIHGAGGGGGSVEGAVSSYGAAGGGGSGAWGQFYITSSLPTTSSFIIGNGGNGGNVSTNANGQSGGVTQITINNILLVMSGGQGAPGIVSSANGARYTPGIRGIPYVSGSVSAIFNESSGSNGQYGIVLVGAATDTPVYLAGFGGKSKFSSGGQGYNYLSNGEDGKYGSGGGGASSDDNVDTSGGNGGDGFIIIHEYA